MTHAVISIILTQSLGQKKTSSTTIIKPELNSGISNGVKLITKKIMKRFSLDLEDVMFSHNRHRDENGKWKREKNEGMKNYICDKNHIFLGLASKIQHS